MKVIVEWERVHLFSLCIILQVYATDKDLSRQNRFRYHLSGDGTGYPNPIFTVEPDTGKIYLRQKLDRDLPEGREVFQFNVIVEDEPDTNQALSGYAYVKVRPMDINDNAPVFREEDLHGSVPEHSNAGKIIVLVIMPSPIAQSVVLQVRSTRSANILSKDR